MYNKIKFFIVFIVMGSIIIYFAYHGFFPFNTTIGKNIHYWIYDNYHIAFNISNLEYKNTKYYCLQSKADTIRSYFEQTNQLYAKITEIQRLINNAKQQKYPISDLDYRLVENKYDYAHSFGDDYYLNKANTAKKILQSKVDFNNTIDKYIKQLEQEGKNINVKIEILDKKMISECCIKLL